MLLNQHRSAIGTFSTPEAAALAFDQLVLSGFPLAKIFLLGQPLNSQGELPIVDYASATAITGTPLGLKKGFLLGNAIGTVTGLLLGVGILALPGIGQVAATSAIAFTLLGGGVGIAAGGIIGALIGLGLTEEQAKTYSRRIAQGNILLVIEGTNTEIDRARQILTAQGIQR